MAVRGPTGRRVTVTVNKNLASELAHSAIMRGKLEEIIAAIAERADATCPVGSEDEHLPPGHEPEALKKSEQHGVIDTPTGLLGVVGYAAWWAHMVHNGTVHSHPNPWLLNAALSVLVKGSAP